MLNFNRAKRAIRRGNIVRFSTHNKNSNLLNSILKTIPTEYDFKTIQDLGPSRIYRTIANNCRIVSKTFINF